MEWNKAKKDIRVYQKPTVIELNFLSNYVKTIKNNNIETMLNE